jgi:O-antigen/teichoic acid export membrane protein
VAKGALFIYIETLVSMGSGYIFWFIMSKISNPEAIGLSSTIISFTVIFSTLASIGIPLGVQRFLGKSFLHNDIDITRKFVKASFVFILIQIWLGDVFKLDTTLLILSIILITSTTVMTLLRSIVISSLNTKMLPIIMIAGTFVKIVLAFLLVINDNGALGIMTGFVFVPILGSILYSFVLLKALKIQNNISDKNEFSYYKKIFISSLANWIPTVVYTVGSHLGTLLVFGSHGALDAGVYFIAFSLSMAISALMSALFTITYPLLSSMPDGRKRFAWRIIKISIVISLPFSISILYYSADVMDIFGVEYRAGSPALVILLLSILPVALITGINNLTYSYGNYRQVLIIGLSSNIPRAFLYFILVPSFEGIGAALSYTTGSLIGLIFSLKVSKDMGFFLVWKDILYAGIVPASILFIMKILDLNFMISILVGLVISYCLLIRLKVLDHTDLEDFRIFIPKRISPVIIRLFDLLNMGNKGDHKKK